MSEKHTPMPGLAGSVHMAMIHGACGHETTLTGEQRCGEVLISQDMTWAKPWKNAPDRFQPVTGRARGQLKCRPSGRGMNR